jgi:hypothetical protein
MPREEVVLFRQIKGERVTMKAVLLFIWLLIVLIGGSMWSGYVLSVMWEWFVVPVFHAPQMSVAVAIGLSMLIGMLTRNPQEESKKETDTASMMVSSFSWAFLYPLFMMGLSYFVHLFV